MDNFSQLSAFDELSKVSEAISQRKAEITTRKKLGKLYMIMIPSIFAVFSIVILVFNAIEPSDILLFLGLMLAFITPFSLLFMWAMIRGGRIRAQRELTTVLLPKYFYLGRQLGLIKYRCEMCEGSIGLTEPGKCPNCGAVLKQYVAAEEMGLVDDYFEKQLK